MIRRLPTLLALTLGLFAMLACSAAYAQGQGAMAPPERGYTIQYLLVGGLMAMAVAAVCKSAYRHSADGEE